MPRYVLRSSTASENHFVPGSTPRGRRVQSPLLPETQRPALLCGPTAARPPKPMRTSKCPWAVHITQQGRGRQAARHVSSLQGSGNRELAQSHLRHWLSVHFKSLSCSEFLVPFWKQGEEASTPTWRLLWGTRRNAKHSWKSVSIKTSNKHHIQWLKR